MAASKRTSAPPPCAADPVRFAGVLVSLASALLAACAQTPPSVPPPLQTPAHYKTVGPWVVATPSDQLPRDAWWRLFGDAELDALQAQLVANSPDLQAAHARFMQAQAAANQLQAARLPSVSASANTQALQQARERPLRVLGPNSPDQYRSSTLGLDMAYELDLWGRVDSLVSSGQAQAQAAQADLASTRLSLQAQLADAYIALRGLDADARLLAQAEAAYARALELVSTRHREGIASGLDLARAESQLQSVRSQAQQSAAQRALLENTIAALVGLPAAAFSLGASSTEIALPKVPLGIASTLLQRRPDVAGAQRRMAAANASVGVAQAAFFPAVTLAATAGFQSSDIRSWLSSPNIFWAIGPGLVLNVFDGGRRQAELERTRAVLDETAARYRGVAIAAFAQVEDALALLSRFQAAAQAEQAQVAASQRSLDLATQRYREGIASYLEVVTSQTALLQGRRTLLDLQTRQRRASVQLVRALGGGWTDTDLGDTVPPRD